MNEKDLIDKINELEVKDNFDNINTQIDYTKYTKKERKQFHFRKVLIPIICCLLLLLIIPFLLIRDGEDNQTEEPDPNQNSDVVKNDGLLYQAAPKADLSSLNLKDNTEYQEFTQKIQLFSARLTIAIYKKSNISDNLCISPISVYMALAMTTASSNGDAKTELLNAIGVTEEEVVNFTKYLYAHLKQEKYTYDYELKEQVLSSILDLNNSIWINQSISLKDPGLQNLANNFNADSYYVPFTSDNEKANELLEKYIEDKTRGLIKPKLELEKSTLFALVNTLYLKDFWDLEDSEELKFTKNECEFTCSNGQIIKKKFMMGEYVRGNIYETETYKHFYICTSGGYTLKFIVPKDGYSVNDVYNVDTILEVNNIKDYNYMRHFTKVIFPSFEASCSVDLINVFKEEFSVNTIFSEGKHMTELTEQTLFISHIIHQTKLKVDEKGVEGAAVTIVSASTESVEDGEWHEFYVDRAFGYLLTDRYGNILFSGVVNEI